MSGYQMQGPIQTMYLAGKERIPTIAGTIAKASNDLSGVMTSLNEQSARAGDPPLLKAMLEVGEQCYTGVRQTAINMDNCAIAIVATADHYVATDHAAQQDFAHLSPKLRSEANPHHHSVTPGIHPGDWSQDGAPPDPGEYRDPQQKPTDTPTTPAPTSPASDQHHRDGTEHSRTSHQHVPAQPGTRPR